MRATRTRRHGTQGDRYVGTYEGHTIELSRTATSNLPGVGDKTERKPMR